LCILCPTVEVDGPKTLAIIASVVILSFDQSGRRNVAQRREGGGRTNVLQGTETA
jgi:hypothetical protein